MKHGIVDTRRDGQPAFYRIASADATALLEMLHRQSCENPGAG